MIWKVAWPAAPFSSARRNTSAGPSGSIPTMGPVGRTLRSNVPKSASSNAPTSMKYVPVCANSWPNINDWRPSPAKNASSFELSNVTPSGAYSRTSGSVNGEMAAKSVSRAMSTSCPAVPLNWYRSRSPKASVPDVVTSSSMGTLPATATTANVTPTVTGVFGAPCESVTVPEYRPAANPVGFAVMSIVLGATSVALPVPGLTLSQSWSTVAVQLIVPGLPMLRNSTDWVATAPATLDARSSWDGCTSASCRPATSTGANPAAAARARAAALTRAIRTPSCMPRTLQHFAGYGACHRTCAFAWAVNRGLRLRRRSRASSYRVRSIRPPRTRAER